MYYLLSIFRAPHDSVDHAVKGFVIVNALNKNEFWYYFIIVLHRVWFWVKCLQQGVKNQNSVLNRVGKISDFRLKQGQGMRGQGCTSPLKNISSTPQSNPTYLQ